MTRIEMDNKIKYDLFRRAYAALISAYDDKISTAGEQHKLAVVAANYALEGFEVAEDQGFTDFEV